MHSLPPALLVSCGGVLGALARHALLLAFAPWSTRAPLGTITINLLGSFAIGVLAGGLVPDPAKAESLRLFVGVGFLGAFTTFSTFSLDTLKLMQGGSWWLGLGNLLLCPLLGLLATWLGQQLWSSS